MSATNEDPRLSNMTPVAPKLLKSLSEGRGGRVLEGKSV